MSNLPSSFSKGAPPQQAKQLSTQPEAPRHIVAADATPAVFVSIIALLIALASFYGTYFMDRPLSASQRAALQGIADQLRALQNKDILLGAPVETTLYLDQSYPAKEMFPPTFNIDMNFSIPLDTQLVAVSATGQPVSFRVQENVPVKATIPVSNKAFGNTTIRISKEFPVEAKFSSVVRVRAAYGKELNSIIDQLEALAGDSSSG